MISVLANRTFRHLFAAQILSLLGSGLTTVALALLALNFAVSAAGAMVIVNTVVYVREFLGAGEQQVAYFIYGVWHRFDAGGLVVAPGAGRCQ